MRVTVNRLTTIPLYRDVTQATGYVGNKGVPTLVGNISADIQPAENRLTAEIYGRKVSEMLSLICPIETDIRDGDSVIIGGGATPTHRIVSVKPYSQHKTALAEKI